MSAEACDTNILVYACDKRDVRKRDLAQDAMDRDEGVLLWQVAVEFIAASRKLADQGFTPQDAWRHLGHLLESLPLIAPSRGTLQLAQNLHVNQRWAFWDAVLVAACLEAGVKRLYSEDLPGHTPPDGLEIVNPFA